MSFRSVIFGRPCSFYTSIALVILSGVHSDLVSVGLSVCRTLGYYTSMVLVNLSSMYSDLMSVCLSVAR